MSDVLLVGSEPTENASPVEGDLEPTPEQKAEILGEEPKAKEGEPAKEKEGETPPPPASKEGKAPLPDQFPKSQADLDKIITERVERERAKWHEDSQKVTSELNELREVVKKIATQKVEPPQKPTIPNAPDEVNDIAGYLNDPTYRGWSMQDLKKEHPDHYEHCKTRILNKMDIDRRFLAMEEGKQKEAQDTQYVEALKPKLAKVRELLGAKAGDFFHADGNFNDRFMKEYVEWGVGQGIYDPLLAYQLKSADGSLRAHHFTDAELDELKKTILADATKKIVSGANRSEPPPRVEGGPKSGASAVSAETETDELKHIFVDKKPGWKKARELLIERGEL